MKLIPLTKDLHAMVDDEDYEWLGPFSWHVRRISGLSYAYRYAGGGRANGRSVSMHTMIAGFAITDHIDGDGLNNQRANLRETTTALNRINTSKGAGFSSRFRGVYWCARSSKWMAWCPAGPWEKGGSRVRLGSFSEEDDAALAADEGLRARFGPHGTYNTPRAGERSALSGGVIPGDLEPALWGLEWFAANPPAPKPSAPTKLCPRCGLVRECGRDKTRADGLSYYCKPCRREQESAAP